mgnify:CR=1 FL=1
MAPIIAFNTYEVAELQRRTHGNPFANADMIFYRQRDDYALNQGVKRYHADAAAATTLSAGIHRAAS